MRWESGDKKADAFPFHYIRDQEKRTHTNKSIVE